MELQQDASPGWVLVEAPVSISCIVSLMNTESYCRSVELTRLRGHHYADDIGVYNEQDTILQL